MFSTLKWHIRRIWKGPGSSTYGSSQSNMTQLIPNHGGLERWLKNFARNAWRMIKNFSIWIIATIILAAIGFFVPYLLGKWVK